MLTRDQKIDIRRAFANNERVSDIAKKYSRTNGAIYAIVSDLPSRPSGETITDEMIEAIPERQKPGPKRKPLPPAAVLSMAIESQAFTVTEIAQKFDVSTITVYNAMRRDDDGSEADQQAINLLNEVNAAREAARKFVLDNYLS